MWKLVDRFGDDQLQFTSIQSFRCRSGAQKIDPARERNPLLYIENLGSVSFKVTRVLFSAAFCLCKRPRAGYLFLCFVVFVVVNLYPSLGYTVDVTSRKLYSCVYL